LRFCRSLDGNQLSGSIPVNLGNLGNLQTLYVSTRIGLFTIVGIVGLWFCRDLSDNQLSDLIPIELANLGNLQDLYVLASENEGIIVDFVGLWFCRVLDHNQLNGPIPIELENLGNLRGLYVFANENLRGGCPLASLRGGRKPHPGPVEAHGAKYANGFSTKQSKQIPNEKWVERRWRV